jgi:RNA polymerase sigma-70 factor (ECF subfamily)
VTIAVMTTRSGDGAAFLDLLLPLLPASQRLAYAMLQNSHDAEDAVQEATFKAWRAGSRFREGSELRPWFLTIVANECRQRRRNRWWSVSKVADLPAIESPGLEGNEDVGELRAALRRLPSDMRLTLVLRYYLDLPFDEIGRVLKCSPQAAKSRTHRALTKLRVEIPEELGP